MTYVCDGKRYEFDHKAFDALVGRSRPGITRAMKKIADALHVSVPSIKEWRRGTHSPSDLEKVQDLATYLGVSWDTLLRREGESAMEISEETLDAMQYEAWCRIYKEIVDYLELQDLADDFVWDEYNLRGYPASLVRDIVPSTVYPPSDIPDNKMLYGHTGIKSGDLHLQATLRVQRAVEHERPILQGTKLLDAVQRYVYEHISEFPYDDEGRWWLDPDLKYDPPYCGEQESPIAVKRLEAQKDLETLLESAASRTKINKTPVSH